MPGIFQPVAVDYACCRPRPARKPSSSGLLQCTLHFREWDGRISKRGNRYLRTLFMQGARVILLRPANWAKHSFGPWLTTAAKRLHHNVLATALANKLARIAWTVLVQARSYEARVISEVA